MSSSPAEINISATPDTPVTQALPASSTTPQDASISIPLTTDVTSPETVSQDAVSDIDELKACGFHVIKRIKVSFPVTATQTQEKLRYYKVYNDWGNIAYVSIDDNEIIPSADETTSEGDARVVTTTWTPREPLHVVPESYIRGCLKQVRQIAWGFVVETGNHYQVVSLNINDAGQPFVYYYTDHLIEDLGTNNGTTASHFTSFPLLLLRDIRTHPAAISSDLGGLTDMMCKFKASYIDKLRSAAQERLATLVDALNRLHTSVTTAKNEIDKEREVYHQYKEQYDDDPDLMEMNRQKYDLLAPELYQLNHREAKIDKYHMDALMELNCLDGAITAIEHYRKKM